MSRPTIKVMWTISSSAALRDPARPIHEGTLEARSSLPSAGDDTVAEPPSPSSKDCSAGASDFSNCTVKALVKS
jgi:hypothetical protein